MYRKIILAGAVLLALAAAVFFKSGEDAAETVLTAFAKANFADSSCHIYREGYLDDKYYMIEEKKDFLEELGACLQPGTDDGTDGANTMNGQSVRISQEQLESGNRVIYEWMAAGGEDRIKLTFLTKERESDLCQIALENYLRAEICLQGEVNTANILKGQENLKKATDNSGLSEQVYVELEGCYDGEMSREEQRLITEALLDEMGASRTDTIDEEALYTVYAYAKGAGETENVAGRQVNVNLAVTYDEEEKQTVFHLGCPIISTDY